MEDYLDAAERLGLLPMFLLALTAGLRQGELIALKWSDLDIKSLTLTIVENRAVVRRELVEYGSQTRSIKPVSYTHLDVYKRQAILSAHRPIVLPRTQSCDGSSAWDRVLRLWQYGANSVGETSRKTQL